MDGEEVASAVEAVEGFWKRLLMSNFLMDKGSDKAGVVALVEFVAIVDNCAGLDAELDTDDTDVDDVDISIGNITDDLDDIEDLPLDDIGCVGRLAFHVDGDLPLRSSRDFGKGLSNSLTEPSDVVVDLVELWLSLISAQNRKWVIVKLKL